jgi:hypothetical protein
MPVRVQVQTAARHGDGGRWNRAGLWKENTGSPPEVPGDLEKSKDAQNGAVARKCAMHQVIDFAQFITRHGTKG